MRSSSRAHSLDLYHEHYVETGYERLELFQLLADNFPIERALYPGCFVHITPSFVFPSTVYVDNDKRAPRFFNDPAVYQYVSKRKAYRDDAEIRFHAADYRTGFDEPQESFDTHRHRTTYRLSRDDLTSYFVPKPGKTVTQEYVQKVDRGIGYRKTADACVFRRDGY